MTTTETTLPLGKLMPCPDNVRRTHNEAAVAEMAASLEHHGLLHNLVVRRAPKGGSYEVVAGGRRLTALRRLLKEGRAVQGVAVTKAFPVRVMVREDGGTELSLAENVQRVAMTPVDEILAYRDLAAKGEEVENIAARFGQSPITVRQRLRLACLSERILGVLREGEMSLEQAKALALSDNHAAQEQAWFEQSGWNREPYSLRSFLMQSHVRASDRLARYVGLEAYEAAGGTVQRDLFAEDQTTYLTDRPLLVKLATARLEVIAEELRQQGWKWVEVCLDRHGLHGSGYGRIHATRRNFTESEQAERDALAEEYDLLVEGREDMGEDDPAREAQESRLQEIETRLDALEVAVTVYAPAAMALAGCQVGIGHDGGVDIAMGLVKCEDAKAVAALRGGDSGADREPAGGGDTGAPEPAGKSGYAAPLVEELTAIRTAALRVELANRPQLALAALLLPLVSRLFHGHAGLASYDNAVEIRGEFRDLTPSIRDVEASRPLMSWKEAVERWGDHIPGTPADLWPWLLAQDGGRLLDLLALVTAANLNAVSVRQEVARGRMAQADLLADAVGLDMTAWWSPEEPFLSRLSKAEIAALLREAGCPDAAAKAVEKAPKDSAVAMAERELAGKGWLPEFYRRPGALSDEPDTLPQAAE